MSNEDKDAYIGKSERAGYRNPPRSTRFRKGQSGNPRGRPKNRHRQAPYEAVLGQDVTIREGGETRRVTAAEAFLQQLTKRGLEGNAPATRDLLEAIDARRDRAGGSDETITFTTLYVSPGCVNPALKPLRMAKKLDPYRDTARMKIEPWLVEAALARFGDRRLSREEQQIVVDAARTPHRIQWPDWWTVKPWENQND